MCEAEKIYANDKVSVQRIKEENEKRLSEAGKIGATITNNFKSGCVQMDAGRKQQRDRSTNTREQRAKIAGVSAGTVARYDTVISTLAYDTKEEVMRWMLDIQLGRRNLSPIQRIAVAEKYRPLYEKEAKENQSKAGKEYGNGGTKLTANLPQALHKEKKSVIQVRIKN